MGIFLWGTSVRLISRIIGLCFGYGGCGLLPAALSIAALGGSGFSFGSRAGRLSRFQKGFRSFSLPAVRHDGPGLLRQFQEQGFVGVFLRQLGGPAAAGLGGTDAFLDGGDPGDPGDPGGGVGLGDFCGGEVGIAAAGGGGGLPGLLDKGVGFEPGGSFHFLFRGEG